MRRKQYIVSLMILVFGLIAALFISQIESVTPSSHAEEQEEHGEEGHHEEDKGPHGGILLGEDQAIQLEVKGVEEVSGQLQFLIYALKKGETLTLNATDLKLEWQRLGETQLMKLTSQKNTLFTQDYINEPHSFKLKASLNQGGTSYSYTWESHENRVEMSDKQIKANQLVFENVGPQHIAEEIELPGKIAVDQDRLVHVSPRVTGIVQGVYKHLGEAVSKGELLAVLDSRELGDLKLEYLSTSKSYEQARKNYDLEQIFYKNTQALLDSLAKEEPLEKLHQKLLNTKIGSDRQILIKAYTAYTLAKDNFHREKNLLALKATTEMDYQQAEKAYQDAKSTYQGTLEEVARQRYLQLLDKKLEMEKYAPDLDVARKKLKTLGLNAGDSSTRYELRSPIQGTLISKHIARGETLNSQTNAFEIADLSVVWAEMMASESQHKYLRMGLPVKILSQDRSHESLGNISHLGSIVDETNRTVEAHSEILNPDRIWKPGMFVTVELQNNPRRVPLAVKKSAIQTLKGEPFVFVRDGQAIQGVPVELGQESSIWVEIKSGLKPGQRYLTQNSYLIKAELEKSSAAHSH